jgi:hypothetical protein
MPTDGDLRRAGPPARTGHAFGMDSAERNRGFASAQRPLNSGKDDQRPVPRGGLGQ